jgi:hypothetical protein
MLFKNPVRTSKRTPHFTITKINWLTLFKEIIAVYSENHKKPTKTKCRVVVVVVVVVHVDGVRLHLLMRPPTCLSPRWYMSINSHGGMISTGKNPKNSEKNLSQCHFVHQKPHMNWPGPEPKYRVADYWSMWDMYSQQGFKRLLHRPHNCNLKPSIDILCV